VSSYAPTQIVYQFGSFCDTNGLAPVNSGDQYQVTAMGKTFAGAVAYSGL
jgi:hypothetical protein